MSVGQRGTAPYAWPSTESPPGGRTDGSVARVPVLTALPTGPCCLEISQTIADLPPLPFAHIVRL